MHERTDEIRNSTTQDIEVWFEPWGMPHNLPSGKSFTVISTSEVDGRLEIEHSENTIVVYAFPTATLKVFLDDALVDDFNIKFPDLPPQMTTKGFINFFFGRPQ